MEHVACVFASKEAKSHWTTQRLWSRMGLKPADIPHQFVCGPQLLKQLAHAPVKAVVVFGEQALYEVLHKRELLRWMHRAVPLQLEKKTLWVVPTLAPDQLLPYKTIDDDDDRKGLRHPPRFTGAVVSAVRKAMEIAVHGHTKQRVDYLEDPSVLRFTQYVDEFYAWVATHPDTILSSDIETAYKLKEQDEDEFEERERVKDGDILRVSFSYRAGTAVSIPWLAEYKPQIKRLLAYTGWHCGWNCVAFDQPVLAANGTPIGGTLLDGMDGWHLLQTDLDKGLEFVSAFYTDLDPWKHLNDAMPSLYSCIDADAALRNVEGILQDLRQRGLYERFLREMELMQVLRRAGDHGNWIDEPKRQAFKQELEELLYTKLLEAQALVNPKFARIKYYKRIPKGTDPERMVATTTTTTVMGCNACGKPKVSVKHKCAVSAEWQKVAMPIETTVYHDRSPLQDATTLEAVLEALKTSGFNPCSAHQLKAYMRAHKHPVGKNWKTDKDSADVKHIKKLMSKYHTTHPIYAHTVEIRQIQKTLSTYVNGLAPDANNLVHCTYVNSPSTWRLGCRNFNAQNLGKRNNNLYAKKARQIIVPRPGHVLVTADSSSIEAVMVGRLMQDTQYEQLARKGIHSYVTCQWLQLPFTPENIKRIKTEYAGLYDTFKTINHATNYGMGPYMMYMNEPEKFPTLHKAKEFQEYLFSQLPGLKEWHHQLRLTAKKNGYLDSPWGVRHYFYDVFTYQYDSDRNLVLDDDGQAKIKLGKDANKVIAFKPQNSAAMFMRDNLVQLAKTPLAPYMPAVVSIHDGYTVDVPEAMEQQAIEILVEILTRPIPEMDGLRVGCEVEVARENFGQPVSVLKVEV